MPPSPLTSLITIIALLLYFILGLNVGIARAKFKIPAPQISGDPNFERVFRVHQNTLEQLLIFLPALWLFSIYSSPQWGAGLGATWILGRIVFAWGYYQAAEKRSPGFAISGLSSLILLIGAAVALIQTLVASII
ncbi:MAG: MAPEG family protein [Cyanobacteria bacterium WB6_1B_304]|jgi:uncharacterized membrane protein YecN with MAPEG domain|nr:MAPEG family protein [Cyanobacteria bacterium WB6_1B_304]